MASKCWIRGIAWNNENISFFSYEASSTNYNDNLNMDVVADPYIISYTFFNSNDKTYEPNAALSELQIFQKWNIGDIQISQIYVMPILVEHIINMDTFFSLENVQNTNVPCPT